MNTVMVKIGEGGERIIPLDAIYITLGGIQGQEIQFSNVRTGTLMVAYKFDNNNEANQIYDDITNTLVAMRGSDVTFLDFSRENLFLNLAINRRKSPKP